MAHTRFLSMALLLTFATPAVAQSSSTTSDPARMYEAGERAFRVGNFDEAIAQWCASYKISGEPLLLYNLAQAYRVKGDNKQALFFYEQYLGTNPPPSVGRDKAQQRVIELKAVIAAQQTVQTAPPQGPVARHGTSSTTEQTVEKSPSPPPAPWFHSGLGWSFAAVALASTAVATVLFVRANDVDTAASRALSLQEQSDDQNSASTYRVGAWSVVAAGSAALLASIGVFVYRDVKFRNGRRARNLALRVSPTSLAFGGTW